MLLTLLLPLRGDHGDYDADLHSVVAVPLDYNADACDYVSAAVRRLHERGEAALRESGDTLRGEPTLRAELL